LAIAFSVGVAARRRARRRPDTESNPIPPDAKMPRGGERNGQCGVEKMERKGGTVSWATECTTPQRTIRSEGTAHYDGDRR